MNNIYWESKVAFFDRDGVINVDFGFVHKVDNFVWVNGAMDAIKLLKELGYIVVVVTNQGGIARGFYTEADVQDLHKWMNNQLSRIIGFEIDAFYYCPHHVDGVVEEYSIECFCRKPNAGMLEKAINYYNADRNCSFLVGDKDTDIMAAQNAHIRGFLFDGRDLLDFIRCNIIGKLI